MQTKLGSGELLDHRGHLLQRGWAETEARRYRRSAIAASAFRIKEWDYYCVLNKDYGFALTVADNGYLGFLSATWLDFTKPATHTQSAMLPFPMGRMAMPESAEVGDIVHNHSRLGIAFRHEAGGRKLTVDCPSFCGGEGLKGELFLAPPPMGRMTIATPFHNAPKAFYYNQKINCMPASGEVSIGSRKYDFDPASAAGVLDWGRGVWTYRNTWYWGSASGWLDGVPFGFNIGHGFGDTSAATENMLFYGKEIHKLDQVTFHLPQGTYDGAPWKFTSNDKRFELEFEPIVDRASAVDVRIIRSIQHQVFGRFSGNVTLDSGRVLRLKAFPGFAEEVENCW
ncbi:MAG: DUF2804 domain-containing protein [Micropepsaceae bacterium]